MIKKLDSIKQIEGAQSGWCWGFLEDRKVEVFPHPSSDPFGSQYVQVEADDAPEMGGFVFLAFAASVKEES